MPQPSFGPTLDASGVLASRLLEYLANKRPSAQERLGNKRLDEARDLAKKNETLIDMEIARVEALQVHTAEVRVGLGGLLRFLQAQEYRKSAKEALRFVKTASDRGRDAIYAMLGQQRPMGLNPMLFILESGINVQVWAEMKPKVTTLVQHRYQFNTNKSTESIHSNVKLAEMLLRDMNFIYPDPSDRGGGNRHSQYRHLVIQEAINETLFRTKDDVGVMHIKHFSPMPIPIIAVILTVVQRCIEEWSEGQREDSSWDEDESGTQAVYASHLSSLFDFQAKGLEEMNVDVLCQLQWDLLKRARAHAGITPVGKIPIHI